MGRIVEGDYVGSATVGPKGQVVLPVNVRKALNLKPKDQVLFYMRPDKGHVKVIKAELVTALMNKALEEIVDLGKIVHNLNKTHKPKD